MSSNLITASNPVFRGRIRDELGTATGQQVLAYLNASPTARAAIAAMQAGTNQQSIELGESTQYDDRDRRATLSEGDWENLDASTIAIRLIHEIGHARDLVPIANVADFKTPGAYADARAAGEGAAFWYEYLFRRDLRAYNGLLERRSDQLVVPTMTGDTASVGLSEDQRLWQAGLEATAERIFDSHGDPAARFAAARTALGRFSDGLQPGNTDGEAATYRQADIRFYVLNAMGYTGVQPAASQVRYWETSDTSWAATFEVPGPQPGRVLEYTYVKLPAIGTGDTELPDRFSIEVRTYETSGANRTLVRTELLAPNTQLQETRGQPTIDGTPVSVVTPQGHVLSTHLELSDGTRRLMVRNETGFEVGYIDTRVYDDGSRLVQTVRQGSTVSESYDVTGRIASRASIDAAGVEVSERFTSTGATVFRDELRALGNGSERSTTFRIAADGDETVVRERVVDTGTGPSAWTQVSRTVTRHEGDRRIIETFDAADDLSERIQERPVRLSDGSVATERMSTNVATGISRQRTLDRNGNVLEDEQGIDPGTFRTAEGFALAATDALTATNAFARGDQVTGSLATLRTVTRVVGTATTSTELNATGGVLDGLLSLANLRNAVRSGDDLSVFSAGANTLNVINRTIPLALGQATPLATSLNAVFNGTGANGVGDFAGLVQGGVPGVVPVVNLITGIRSEDPIAITQGLIGLLQPSALAGPVGWFLAAVSILRAIDAAGDVPFQWGSAKFRFGTDPNTPTAVAVDVSGQGSLGYGKINEAIYGTQPAEQPATVGLLTALQSIVAQSPTAPDGSKLVGIIPQRMPTLGWNESRYGGLVGYQVQDIDPTTGLQKNPDLRWDDNFSAYNAAPGNAEQQQTLPQTLLRSALAREAIAPMWEVLTARMQEQIGDPYAGLSEVERAARIGIDNGVQTTARFNPTTGLVDNAQFRPITLDLSGNGRIDVLANAAVSVAFDWDDTGYHKQVSWVAAQDGFLVLDRNLDGRIDHGSELFSNPGLADSIKGVRSLNWADANADGLIDASDPVFTALRVWRDHNGNGISDGTGGSNELDSLSALGISRLSIAANRFTRQGQEHLLASMPLEAEAQGTRVTGVTGGIQVLFSGDALPTIYVTNFNQGTQNTGTPPSGGASTFTASADSFVVDEDGGADASDGRQEQTKSAALKIRLSELLRNDAGYNGSMNQVGFAGVMNAVNCTVSYVAGSDEVSVHLPQHGTQTARFDYQLIAPTNPSTGQLQQTLNVAVTLMINPIDDRPTVAIERDPARPVYGYGGFFDYTTDQVDEHGITVPYLVYKENEGLPIHVPYQTLQGQPIIVTDTYGSPSTEYGALTDTGLVAGDLSLLPEASGAQAFSVRVRGTSYLVDPSAPRIHHATVLSHEPANDGWIRVTDPDTTGYWIHITEQPNSGRVDFIESNSGRFSYTGFRPVDQDLYGNLVRQNVFTDQYVRNEAFTNDFFKVILQEGWGPRAGGSFGPHTVDVVHYGPKVTNVAYGGKTPIALDMDGDGQIRFTDVDMSDVFFEVNDSGWKRKIAWLRESPSGGHDGFLAYDKDQDGKISRFDELGFSSYALGAQTDLEGL
jgi:hypothetical protein